MLDMANLDNMNVKIVLACKAEFIQEIDKPKIVKRLPGLMHKTDFVKYALEFSFKHRSV